MTSPVVSVILPTLNDAEYVAKAIESVISQTYTDFEIIVVDDGSTDGTIEYLNDHPDDRIELIVRQEESGITSAINRGIRESQGKFIARHDADDWSDDERLEKQVAYLDRNSEVVLVGTGAYLVDEGGIIQSQRRVLESPSLDDLINHNEFVHGSVMMRKAVLESVGGYDEWFHTTEDYDLWLRLAEEYEVRNIDEPLYYFRQHDESLYGSNLEELKLYHLLAVRRVTSGIDDEIRSLIDEEGIDALRDRLTESEKRWFHTELAREFLRYGDLRSGREHVVKALRLDPVSVSLPGMLLLSMTTPSIAKAAARAYRRLINMMIGLRNWRS